MAKVCVVNFLCLSAYPYLLERLYLSNFIEKSENVFIFFKLIGNAQTSTLLLPYKLWFHYYILIINYINSYSIIEKKILFKI